MMHFNGENEQGGAALTDKLSSLMPDCTSEVLKALESAGFEAWVVGGFVRDALLGRPKHDTDIATSARPEQVKEICQAAGMGVFETGIKHGTVTVVPDVAASNAANAANPTVEVTTFRRESAYGDHRHPDAVEFVDNVFEDLARRDFTMNAMAFHPERGLLDPYDGQTDLQRGIIRCVGDPKLRFSEDALRIMRAVRFASQLGFELEDRTAGAAFARKRDLNRVAGERLAVEIEKMLCGAYIHDALMEYSDILGQLMPELNEMKGFDQRTRYHCYDVLEHTAYVIHHVPASDVLGRWAALFHDMGKPEKFFVDDAGVGHMYGHEAASVGHMEKAAALLKFSAKRTHDLQLLVRHHDFRPALSRKAVRKLYAKLEFRDDLFPVMCDLMRADALGHAPAYRNRVGVIDQLEHLFYQMKEEEECLSLKNLAINGDDLMAMGVEQGPQVGELLRTIFDRVSDEKLDNERTELLAYARLIVRQRL